MERLPPEVLAHILTFLPFDDKIALMTVSRPWCLATRVALKRQNGFIVGGCMGNKHFCDEIPDVGHLDTISERAVRVSQYRHIHETQMRSRLSVICPNVQILCDSCCDPVITTVLLRDYREKLKYLQLDSPVRKLDKVGVFFALEYLKYATTINAKIRSLKHTFPKLQYVDCSGMTSEQMTSLPFGLRGIKLYNGKEDCVRLMSQSEARQTLEVLHLITERLTTCVESFQFPNLKDVSIRGLEDLSDLFSSLTFSRNLTKLHVSARCCVKVGNNVLLSALEQLDHLTSLNLRFIVVEDPVPFWTRMVQIFAAKLQHLTFSTHFVTSECIQVMAGFAALQTLTLTFIYDQPVLYNNVPESIRNRDPFSATDLLAFFQTPTASKNSLRDISIQMQSLGRDAQVRRDLESELKDMKQNNQLESGEIREQGNRNSIYV